MSAAIKTLIALMAASGLWALIYFYEYGGEAGRLEARDAESKVFTMDEESISTLEVAGSGNTVALRRDGTDWTIVEPMETRADKDKVGSILSAASRLRVDERLEDVPESEMESFGLRETPTRIRLASAGEQGVELVVGGKVPVTGGYYAKKAGDPAVLVVTGGLESLTSASLESLRYKKIVGVDLWELSGFALTGGGAEVRMAREDDLWRLQEPVSFPADQGKIRDLWSGLQWLEAQGVAVEHPEPEDLVRLGLDPPALRLSLETEKEAFSVDFGGADESGAIFVRRSDLESVMTVPKETLDRLEAARDAVDDLRDARLAPVDRFRLDRIEIVGEGPPLVLIKNDGGSWKHEGDEGQVQRERVDSLLDAVEDLRAGAFEEKVLEESPQLTMTFTEKAGGEGADASIITIRLIADQEEEREDRRMLSTMAPTTVYRVPAINVQTLIDRVAAIDEPVEDKEQGGAE